MRLPRSTSLWLATTVLGIPLPDSGPDTVQVTARLLLAGGEPVAEGAVATLTLVERGPGLSNGVLEAGVGADGQVCWMLEDRFASPVWRASSRPAAVLVGGTPPHTPPAGAMVAAETLQRWRSSNGGAAIDLGPIEMSEVRTYDVTDFVTADSAGRFDPVESVVAALPWRSAPAHRCPGCRARALGDVAPLAWGNQRGGDGWTLELPGDPSPLLFACLYPGETLADTALRAIPRRAVEASDSRQGADPTAARRWVEVELAIATPGPDGVAGVNPYLVPADPGAIEPVVYHDFYCTLGSGPSHDSREFHAMLLAGSSYSLRLCWGFGIDLGLEFPVAASATEEPQRLAFEVPSSALTTFAVQIERSPTEAPSTEPLRPRDSEVTYVYRLRDLVRGESLWSRTGSLLTLPRVVEGWSLEVWDEWLGYGAATELVPSETSALPLAPRSRAVSIDTTAIEHVWERRDGGLLLLPTSDPQWTGPLPLGAAWQDFLPLDFVLLLGSQTLFVADAPHYVPIVLLFAERGQPILEAVARTISVPEDQGAVPLPIPITFD
jgi:hypothetical protein